MLDISEEVSDTSVPGQEFDAAIFILEDSTAQMTIEDIFQDTSTNATDSSMMQKPFQPRFQRLLLITTLSITYAISPTPLLCMPLREKPQCPSDKTQKISVE